jgi:hypothetical protein
VKTSSSGRARKIGTFPHTILPTQAALT